VLPRTPKFNSAGYAAGQDRFRRSEEAARDTTRPRTEDLEDGVPLPLRPHGLETLRALAEASANTAERRVQKKNIQFDAARSSWQHLFDPSKSDSLVARGYAAKGGTGADYGRYWITAAGLEYLAAADRAAVADADADEDLDLVDADAAADDDDHDDAPAPAAAPARVHAARAARLSKELGSARRAASSARASMAASTSSFHVWKLGRERQGRERQDRRRVRQVTPRSPSSPAPRVPRHRAPRDDLLAETHKKRLDRRGIGVFRRDNGPLNAAMVYPKIGVCWGSLRVAATLVSLDHLSSSS
jgi:hypothetical protein